jgi:hypothetical protein
MYDVCMYYVCYLCVWNVCCVLSSAPYVPSLHDITTHPFLISHKPWQSCSMYIIIESLQWSNWHSPSVICVGSGIRIHSIIYLCSSLSHMSSTHVESSSKLFLFCLHISLCPSVYWTMLMSCLYQSMSCRYVGM